MINQRLGGLVMTPAIRNMTSVYFTDETGIWCLFRIGSRIADRLYIGAAGGHFEENEMRSPEKCILREMKEELDLSETDISDLRLRYITSRLKNNEIHRNYYFFARLNTAKSFSSNEGTLHHISYEQMKTLPMPVSARYMMEHYLKEGRYTDHLYAGITEKKETRFVILEEF